MRLEREARGELPLGLPAAQANWAEIEGRLGRLAVVHLLRFGTEVVADPPAGSTDRQSGSQANETNSGAAGLNPHPNPLPLRPSSGQASPGRGNTDHTLTDDKAPSPFAAITTIRPPFGPAPGFGGRIRVLAREVGAAG